MLQQSQLAAKHQLWRDFKGQLGADSYNSFEEYAIAEIIKLRADNELYSATLQFYAKGIKTLIDPCAEGRNEVAHIAPDDGSRAREALNNQPGTQSRQVVDSRFQIDVTAPGHGSREGHEPGCNYPAALCICQNPPAGTRQYITVNMDDVSARETMLASEDVLHKDWDTDSEDDAWAHLSEDNDE